MRQYCISISTRALTTWRYHASNQPRPLRTSGIINARSHSKLMPVKPRRTAQNATRFPATIPVLHTLIVSSIKVPQVDVICVDMFVDQPAPHPFSHHARTCPRSQRWGAQSPSAKVVQSGGASMVNVIFEWVPVSHIQRTLYAQVVGDGKDTRL
jgi:hypothetical protein